VPPFFKSAPTDPTLDAAVVAVPKRRCEKPCERIKLVEGSDPQISRETASLLRVRLRAAGLSLAAVALIAAFLVLGEQRLPRCFELGLGLRQRVLGYPPQLHDGLQL